MEDYLEVNFIIQKNWPFEREYASCFVAFLIREWQNGNPETPCASSSRSEKNILCQTEFVILPMLMLQHSHDTDEYI